MVEVLDCTLRDGGYYTNWDFEPDVVASYFSGLAKLPISYVEVGYINDVQQGYFGEYYFLTREKLELIREILRPDQKLVVMIDGKGYKPERIEALFTPIADLIDLVRITVAPAALAHGAALAKALKAVGLKVGYNVMYLSTFQNNLGEIGSALKASDCYDSLALVDSYGGCTPASVEKIFRELRAALPDKIIGFHGHDNMCLAFANSLAAIEGGADVVDGTFTGMGRGAGNLRTETMLIHLAGRQKNEELDYQGLSTAVAPFEEMRQIYRWGTNLPYMISGANNLPQKDVMDWISKNRYSVLSIIRALQQQSGGEVDDKIHPELSGLATDAKAVVVVGGGLSVTRHAGAIRRFVEKMKPVVLFSSSRHLGLAGALGGQQLLCLPGHDAFRPGTEEHLATVSALVVPSAPRVSGCLPAGVALPVYQAEPASVRGTPTIGPVSDTDPLGLALGAVQALKASSVFLVGFDGYDTASAAEQELSREVQVALDAFRQANPGVKLVSLTPTSYKLDQVSIYGLVAAH